MLHFNLLLWATLLSLAILTSPCSLPLAGRIRDHEDEAKLRTSITCLFSTLWHVTIISLWHTNTKRLTPPWPFLSGCDQPTLLYVIHSNCPVCRNNDCASFLFPWLSEQTLNRHIKDIYANYKEISLWYNQWLFYWNKQHSTCRK